MFVPRIARVVAERLGVNEDVAYVVVYMLRLRLAGEILRYVALYNYIVNEISPAEAEARFKVSKYIVKGMYQRLTERFNGLSSAGKIRVIKDVMKRAHKCIYRSGIVVTNGVCILCDRWVGRGNAAMNHVMSAHSDYVVEKAVEVFQKCLKKYLPKGK